MTTAQKETDEVIAMKKEISNLVRECVDELGGDLDHVVSSVLSSTVKVITSRSDSMNLAVNGYVSTSIQISDTLKLSVGMTMVTPWKTLSLPHRWVDKKDIPELIKNNIDTFILAYL